MLTVKGRKCNCLIEMEGDKEPDTSDTNTLRTVEAAAEREREEKTIRIC